MIINNKNFTKKNLYKILSVFLAGILICSFVISNNITTHAVTEDKPSFSVSEISYSPSEPKVGEDITVTGWIHPKDFEISVPKNEVVLVLDVSASMDTEVSENCTNERIEKWVQGNRWGGHWVYDYCEEHETDGTHKSTRVNELKKAANNFVEKMKTIPNLKVGIVAYSSYAWINPNGKKGNVNTNSLDQNGSHLVPNYSLLESTMLSITDSRLKDMINNLEALGGTNTGEGIRKGIALLNNGDTNAKKTLILMSDGEPTFYSVRGNSSDPYTDIDFNTVKYRGSGSGDDKGNNLKYAKTIGNKLKEKSYNAFTIGYGMSDIGNNKMKQIHNSMTGAELGNNNDSNEEKGFFATSDGAIDGVFNKIASKIISEYPIQNITFNNHMINGFQLAVGQQTVSIPDMNYKQLGDIHNGKITYHCEPYKFSFTIKATRSGLFDKVFDKSTISFDWSNEKISSFISDEPINIIDNSLPNIEATLTSNSYMNVKPDETSLIKYSIQGEPFRYDDASTQILPKDIVIVLDTSSNMSDGDKIGIFKNAIFNDLINSSTFSNKIVRYGLITFNSKNQIMQGLTSDKTYINDNVIKNISLSNSNTREIGGAIEKASRMLDEDTTKSDKYIFMVSSGDVNYSEEEMKKLNGKYKIISLALGSMEQDTGDPAPALKQLHNIIGGDGDGYFISSKRGNNNDTQNIIMKNIAQKLDDSLDRMDYTFNVSLNFDLGDNLDYDNGLQHVEGSLYKKEITVVYKYNKSENLYIAEPIDEVTFSVKPNVIGGICLFGAENIISYKGLIDDIQKKLKTPQIIATGSDIHHGIYQGIDEDGTIQIYESDDTNLSKGSIVTMAAKTQFCGEDKLSLIVDKDAEPNGNLTLYKKSGNQLAEIRTIETNNSKTYDIPVYNTDNININDEILLLYSCKISDNSRKIITNSIKSKYDSDDISIIINKELPELF